MLRKEQLIKTITFKLAHLKACVATQNAVRYFDLNIAAEDFFASLLNALYGYSLVNLNHTNLNTAAIDLGDSTRRLAFQITSERTKAKVQKTVDKFAENGLASDYDKLKILIIGDRTGDYLGLVVPTGISFSGKEDVLDIKDLTKAIDQLDTARLEDIAELMLREIGEYLPRTEAKAAESAELAQIDATQKELMKQQVSQAQQNSELATDVRLIRESVTAMPSSLIPDAIASAHQSGLDVVRDLLKQHKPSQALSLLEKQKEAIWPTASEAIKARILCSLGSARLGLGDERKAAELFLEARQYNSDDEKVLTNAAVAQLLLEQRAEAAETARSLIARNSANYNAYSVLIQASDQPLDRIIEELPEYCRTNAEVALAIGFTARRRGDLESAETWLRAALQYDDVGQPDIKGVLGEVILNRVTSDLASPIRVRQLTDEIRQQLKFSVTLLNDACNTITDESALRVRVTWLLSAAIASRLLSNQPEADRYLARAEQLAPDSPAVVYQCAVAARDRDDIDSAIRFATRIKASSDIPQTPMLYAALLYEAKRVDEAIAAIRVFLESDPADDLARTARQMLVDLHLDNAQHADALRIAEELVAGDPTDVSNLVVSSQVHRAMGNDASADAALDKAVRVVANNTPSTYLLLLGNYLGVAERWSDAADVIQRIVDTGVNSPLTHEYVHACYRAGKLDRAQQLRNLHGPLEFITDVEIAVNEQVGDLPAARLICEEFIAAFPNDGRRMIQLGTIFLRQHDLEALDSLLDSPPEWRDLPVEYVQQLAQLFLARQRHREAVNVLYELRRAHSSGKVHLQYLQTFLFHADHKHEWLDVQEIGADVAVCVKDSTGDTQWYIIEDRDDVDVGKGELSLNHRLAQSLLGKRPGDSVLLKESNMSTESGTVVEIKHKFLHAFHESAKTLEVRFPEQAGGFVSMHLPQGEAGVKQLLDKLGKQQNQQQKAAQQAEELYQSHQLPIGAFARLLGCDVIQAWSHLSGKTKSRIICSTGSPRERQLAFRLLQDAERSFVIDPIALMTIHALGIADEVVKTVGQLGIVQATIDLLTENLHKQEASGRNGFMTLTKQDDVFLRKEVSEEQVSGYLMSLQSLLEWIERNCDVLPWSPALATGRDKMRELREMIGDESLDSVLAAAGNGRALYSDDLRLRQLARSEFEVGGIWTQPVLMRAVDTGTLERERYGRAVVQLAAAGFVHTSIDAHVLLEAARQADWWASRPFTDVVSILGGKQCDEDSAVRVAADFLHLLWRQSVLPHSTDFLVFRLLDELGAERNAHEVSEKLLAAVSQRFTLITVAETQIVKLIRTWRELRIG